MLYKNEKRFWGGTKEVKAEVAYHYFYRINETGSKMDEVILKSLKCGNMELQLDRKLSNKRIFLLLILLRRVLCRDDLLQDKEVLQRI